MSSSAPSSLFSEMVRNPIPVCAGALVTPPQSCEIPCHRLDLTVFGEGPGLSHVVITDVLASQPQDVPQRRGIPQLRAKPRPPGARVLHALIPPPEKWPVWGSVNTCVIERSLWHVPQFPFLLWAQVKSSVWTPSSTIHLPTPLPGASSAAILSFHKGASKKNCLPCLRTAVLLPYRTSFRGNGTQRPGHTSKTAIADSLNDPAANNRMWDERPRWGAEVAETAGKWRLWLHLTSLPWRRGTHASHPPREENLCGKGTRSGPARNRASDREKLELA